MFVKECVVSCHFIFSWYYYVIQWVSMNETPVYNAVLMEVRVQLGTAHTMWPSHRQQQVTCTIIHVWDHLATGSCHINSYFASYFYYTGSLSDEYHLSLPTTTVHMWAR